MGKCCRFTYNIQSITYLTNQNYTVICALKDWHLCGHKQYFVLVWCVISMYFLPKIISGSFVQKKDAHIIQIWTDYEGNSTKYMPEGVRVDNYFPRP